MCLIAIMGVCQETIAKLSLSRMITYEICWIRIINRDNCAIPRNDSVTIRPQRDDPPAQM